MAVGVGRGAKALGLVYFGEMWRGSLGEVWSGRFCIGGVRHGQAVKARSGRA